MSSSLQNIVVIFGLILLVALGYYLYTQNKDSILSSVDTDVNMELTTQGTEIIAKLNELEKLELDGSIFSDPRFRSLVDHTPILQEEEVGRTNPFLKSGSD